MAEPIIEMRNIVTRFGDTVIHDGVNLTVYPGEIYGILGESGAGKSVLVKEIIMLLRPTSGTIKVLGKELSHLNYVERHQLRRSWGVLFQFGALFTSLTVAENIALPLKEYTSIPKDLREKIVREKLEMVGLHSRAAALYPSELSGGMIKRAALARALAMDPKLLFLDEPTSGLDPIGARAFDRLIVDLRDALDITVVMITHDLDSIFTIVDRMAVLADKHVVAEGTLQEVMATDHPFVQRFFKNEYISKRFMGKIDAKDSAGSGASDVQ
ncbi:ABC transporter ATP-binding protein [Nitratifractor salsuginis]|uniref:ABC transporter related protein n=1 Tax=Nitratifractor salsuginis (strain DSM 16511 / JCM 12458 / E9I37-1) TaxID=749222 RepID=E6WYF3_NITSE|nr:ATP-binding cassette domain-containing protein [Nitratifractor salsuginis]ADV46465.1 ABC transporter related protein [Nitratifractor salsuginis DSM 16511]